MEMPWFKKDMRKTASQIGRKLEAIKNTRPNNQSLKKIHRIEMFDHEMKEKNIYIRPKFQVSEGMNPI